MIKVDLVLVDALVIVYVPFRIPIIITRPTVTSTYVGIMVVNFSVQIQTNLRQNLDKKTAWIIEELIDFDRLKSLKRVTRVEVDYVKVNSQCTECNMEVIAGRNLQIPGPECE